MGFAGNEEADKTAKEPLQFNVTECKIPETDLKLLTSTLIINGKSSRMNVYITNCMR